MYELSPPDQVFAFDSSKLKASDVSFWTAWTGELLLGCAALKELSSTQGEIKSMRTPNARRRTGAGRALLNHIIDVARSRGYQVLYLETGRHPSFVPAQTLYGSVGFKRCGPFGPFEKTEIVSSCRAHSRSAHSKRTRDAPPDASSNLGALGKPVRLPTGTKVAPEADLQVNILR